MQLVVFLFGVFHVAISSSGFASHLYSLWAVYQLYRYCFQVEINE